MVEKRKATRRSPGVDYKVDLTINGKKAEAKVLDVSSGGMKMLTQEFLDSEAYLYCKIDIYRDMPAFFVKGSIIRVRKVQDLWEYAVKFDAVRLTNFIEVKREYGAQA